GGGMAEEFFWIDPKVYRWWIGSEHHSSLINFDGNVLPQPTPATLPFLSRRYHEFPAKMNPWLATWIFQRYIGNERVVVEPMAGVGGTAV
ncbi:MAG: hypothetical protein QW756_07555, partial [Nitrososphaerota archaeon]